MNHTKMMKFVKLALNNSNESEATVAASQFFKRLKAAGERFNSKVWGLNGEDARRLMTLGGVQPKGQDIKVDESADDTIRVYTLGDVLHYHAFTCDMDPAKARRILRKHLGKKGAWVFTQREMIEAANIIAKSFK